MVDPGRLSAWFTAYAPALRAYARRVIGAGADDVVQEAFIRLLGQRDEPDDVKAWLFRTVRNAALDDARGNTRRREREARHAVDQAAAQRDGLTRTHTRPPDESAANAEARAAAVNALAALESSARDVIALRIDGGLSFADIAAVTGRPLSSVYDVYRAALFELRRRLGDLL